MRRATLTACMLLTACGPRYDAQQQLLRDTLWAHHPTGASAGAAVRRYSEATAGPSTARVFVPSLLLRNSCPRVTAAALMAAVAITDTTMGDFPIVRGPVDAGKGRLSIVAHGRTSATCEAYVALVYNPWDSLGAVVTEIDCNGRKVCSWSTGGSVKENG